MIAAKKQVAKEEAIKKMKAKNARAEAEHKANMDKVRQAKIQKEAEEEARKEIAAEEAQKSSRAQKGTMDLGE